MVEFIKRERKKQKLSFDKLSELSGVKARTIQNWEYGLAVPTIDKFQKAINALGYDLCITAKETDDDTTK